MKTINKRITEYILEIIFLILIIIVTNIIWKNLSINNYKTTAYTSSNLILDIKNINNQIYLTIDNTKKQDKSYTLYLKVLNNTTDFKININNNIENISNLEKHKEGNEIYYKIDSSNIESNNKKDYKLVFIDNIETLDISFDIKEESI
ncbi:unknown [Clostridium sp. CAG:628]|nr:unknown [Clostridium sp. CAG:628]